MKAKIVKINWLPFKQAEFDIIYGYGISREGCLIDLAVEKGIITKSGAWYSYEEERLGQGKENARDFLKKNPELAKKIEYKLREAFDLPALKDSLSDKDKSSRKQADTVS